MSYKSENVRKSRHKKFLPPPQPQSIILSFLPKYGDLPSSNYCPIPIVALLTSFHGAETAIGHVIWSLVLLFGTSKFQYFLQDLFVNNTSGCIWLKYNLQELKIQGTAI